jgi:hypothetical protein
VVSWKVPYSTSMNCVGLDRGSTYQSARATDHVPMTEFGIVKSGAVVRSHSIVNHGQPDFDSATWRWMGTPIDNRHQVFGFILVH